MQFRKDINGIRAIAVIAVVLFHFNASWMSGGYAGVDVFFVISGFLMTGIIFKGIEQKNFSVLQFYIARANRIVPALAALCLVLLVFGWFYLTPMEYKELGKHAGSSIGFFSNFIYWRESGYFDATSHEKWLLHTWSLSAEWQFYMLYPLMLVVMRKFMSIATMKKTILLATVLGFMFCIIVTYKWPNPAYYLLPTRAWEMMIGGVAFLYPLSLRNNRKKFLEWFGLVLIVGSYFIVSKNDPWPGYLALFPVMGCYFIILANRNYSIITSNAILQSLGSWSYSIYLWHWPFVVAIYYFSLSEIYIYFGITLSVLLGFLSSKYIEKIRFNSNFGNLKNLYKCKPVYMMMVIGLTGTVVFLEDGFFSLSPAKYQSLVLNAISSPYRKECHLGAYQNPAESCEYFEGEISWATFGDSHSTEIAYALAEKLKSDNIGLKHFSFSACKPSYQENENFNHCSKWYNEAVEYILNDNRVKNIVFIHRYTNAMFGGDAHAYPNYDRVEITSEVIRMTKHLDELILELAANKDNVYVFYPVPELQRNINQLMGIALRNKNSLDTIVGTDMTWYNKRNRYIIEHFDNSEYPENVHLLKPQDVYCDTQNCHAVLKGVPLYFDDHHPSVLGAAMLVDLINYE